MSAPSSGPVTPEVMAWIDARWAFMAERFGPHVPADARAVLPTPSYFPDAYAGTVHDAARLGRRVAGYMGIDPETVWFDVFDHGERRPDLADGVTSSALGYYEEIGPGRCRVWADVRLLDDPAPLVAVQAHELAHARLLGGRHVDPDEPDMEPLTDLATVFFGMGVIVANAAVWERTVNDGLSGWWQTGRRGYLPMAVYGYALAHFALARGETDPRWPDHLRPDVRAELRRGLRHLSTQGNTAPPWPGGPAPFAVGPPTDHHVDEVSEPPAEGCVYCGEPAGEEEVCEACRMSAETNSAGLTDRAAWHGDTSMSWVRWVWRIGLGVAGLLMARALI